MSSPMERLSAAVKRRREELGLSQNDVNARGGPSDTTLAGIEDGTGPMPRAKTLRSLDEGLGWEPGTSRAVLDGLEPGQQPDVKIDYTDAQRRSFIVEAKQHNADRFGGEGTLLGEVMGYPLDENFSRQSRALVESLSIIPPERREVAMRRAVQAMMTTVMNVEIEALAKDVQESFRAAGLPIELPEEDFEKDFPPPTYPTYSAGPDTPAEADAPPTDSDPGDSSPRSERPDRAEEPRPHQP